MSKLKTITKFELLPNEILIECFEYLNGLNIYHSFYRLNYRFNKLIRNIPLYMNFENSQQAIFHQFCMELSTNQEIKEQIYSLHLSNGDSCWQIQPFLSRFSLDEFVHLRSLTLTGVNNNNVPQLITTLPLISQLSCFRLIDNGHIIDRITFVIPMINLRTLILCTLSPQSALIFQLSSIINLTIYSCDLIRLFLILSNATRLRYLNASSVYKHADVTKYHYISALTNPAIYLKQLVIVLFRSEFDDFAMMLKQTPNLKSLTIDTGTSRQMIDAAQWEDLITSSLPQLTIFKFSFKCLDQTKNSILEEKFQQFQSYFWQKQHHWYTEYSLSNSSPLIYTIPYLSNKYELKPNTKRYCNLLMHDVNIFDNVMNLITIPDTLERKCQYHFPQVTSVIFEKTWDNWWEKSWESHETFLLETKHIDSLKMIVNLSNIKHLKIADSFKLATASVLLQLLKEAQQISSLTINPFDLKLLFNDNELCKYLNKMIKKLDIVCTSNDSFKNLDELDQFCKRFSNLEQLNSAFKSDNESLLFVIKHLPKLARFNNYPARRISHDELSWMNEELRKGDSRLIVDVDYTNSCNISIWIIRNIY